MKTKLYCNFRRVIYPMQFNKINNLYINLSDNLYMFTFHERANAMQK